MMRSSVNWEILGVVVFTTAGIVLASMGLVTARNRHRADSTAVEWALDALHNLPDGIVRQVYDPIEFTRRVEQFRDAIRRDKVPVDSVRNFYQAYARQARDGHITATEVGFLGTYFGLPRRTALDSTESEDRPSMLPATLPGR